MINYAKQYISKKDIIAVVRTLKSDYLTTGPAITKFEKKINKYTNSKFAVSVNSATSALHISCLALGLKKGDILWTTPNSFVASANCALYCGASIDFVDISPDDFNISVTLLKKKLALAAQKKKLPKIIVPVHFGGSPCEMKEIYKLSKKYRFKIIEDASHALGGTYLNKKIGSCQFSNITIFSFHPVKIITTFEGGIATTNNKEIFNKLNMLKNHGIDRNFKKTNKDKLRAFYKQEMLGFNYRMNDVQASIGISQLERINFFLKKRRAIVKFYDKNFKNLNIIFQKKNKESQSSNHLYVIRIKKNKKNNRDGLLTILKKKKINSTIHYIPIHFHPYYKNLGFKKGDFINSEKFYEEAISLPIYPSLNFNQLNYIVRIIKNYIK